MCANPPTSSQTNIPHGYTHAITEDKLLLSKLLCCKKLGTYHVNSFLGSFSRRKNATGTDGNMIVAFDMLTVLFNQLHQQNHATEMPTK